MLSSQVCAHSQELLESLSIHLGLDSFSASNPRAPPGPPGAANEASRVYCQWWLHAGDEFPLSFPLIGNRAYTFRSRAEACGNARILRETGGTWCPEIDNIRDSTMCNASTQVRMKMVCVKSGVMWSVCVQWVILPRRLMRPTWQVDLGDIEEAVLWYGDDLELAVDTHRSFDARTRPHTGASTGSSRGNESEIIAFDISNSICRMR